ncbi:MAG: hypothetical protein KDA60_01765 [Planctomycetales bacterium]|nr:hypothetical protein [Planctomycetales bacterium]
MKQGLHTKVDVNTRSPRPPYIFIVGALFILAITAVQVWRSSEQDSCPIVLPTPSDPPIYRARLRAEVALAEIPPEPQAADPEPPIAAPWRSSADTMDSLSPSAEHYQPLLGRADEMITTWDVAALSQLRTPPESISKTSGNPAVAAPDSADFARLLDSDVPRSTFQDAPSEDQPLPPVGADVFHRNALADKQLDLPTTPTDVPVATPTPQLAIRPSDHLDSSDADSSVSATPEPELETALDAEMEVADDELASDTVFEMTPVELAPAVTSSPAREQRAPLDSFTPVVASSPATAVISVQEVESISAAHANADGDVDQPEDATQVVESDADSFTEVLSNDDPGEATVASEPTPVSPRRRPSRRVRRSQPRAATTEPDSDPLASVRASGAWPATPGLLETLDSLAGGPRVDAWREHVVASLEQLQQEKHFTTSPSREGIRDLYALSLEAETLATQLFDPSQQSQLRRANYSLRRRLDIWLAVERSLRPEHQQRLANQLAQVDPGVMAQHVERVANYLSTNKLGEGWTQFLMLDDLRQMSDSSTGQVPTVRSRAAQRILRRTENPHLNEEQDRFLRQEPLAGLIQELKVWSTAPLPAKQFLATLELFEASPSSSHAMELASCWKALRWSQDEEQQKVADVFEQHYRNANIRLSITEDMINRMVPDLDPINESLRENIMDAKVTGQSVANTRLRVNLLPDTSRLRMLLEARGQLRANTTAIKGPVTLFNRNQSNFVVRKMLTVGPSGVRVGRANAAASGNLNLVGMRTLYDKFPVVGSIVRNAAKKQVDEQHGMMRRMFASRVANQASQRLESQVEEQLAAAEQKMRERVIEPLEKLNLDPTTLQTTTSEDRLILRSRLAGQTQLAAFTPRPMAHRDNMLSIQLHESALNNFIQQLGLDGRKGDLREIYEEVAGKVAETSKSAPRPVDIPDGVQLKLADQDAVFARCVDGHVELSLNFDYLVLNRRVYRNFVVQAIYHPYRDGIYAYLQRDEYIRLRGRLSLAHQVALRAIFTRVLSQDQRFDLVHPKVAEDERFAGLSITQLYIDNGWIGVSFDEKSPAAAVPNGRPAQAGTQVTNRRTTGTQR